MYHKCESKRKWRKCQQFALSTDDQAHDEAHDDGIVDSEATDIAKPTEQSGDPKHKIGSRQFKEEKRRKREEAKKRREEEPDAMKKK